MNHDQARTSLLTALEQQPAGLANVLLRGDDMASAEVSKFDLTDGMAETVSADVLKAAGGLARKEFVPYDPSYQTSQAQVLVENLSEIPDLAAIDEKVRRGDLPLDSGGPAVVAMAHAVGTGDAQILAYRVKGPGIATRRARGVLQLIPRDGIYQPIQEEILYYEPRFDVFTCSSWAFFVAATLVQSKLNAPEKAQALARETLRTVTTNISIDGFAELEGAVISDPTMRSKMAQIARIVASDPAYAASLTTENLVDFVQANPGYDIQLIERDGTQILKFDPSPQHRHQIPKLLADDYLHSELTNRNYEAGSKHRVTK